MKKSLLLSIVSLGIIAFVLMSGEETAHTFSGNPPGFNSGAPGQSSCSNANCHDSNTPNNGPGSVSIGFADGTAEYEAGETYEMSVTIEENGAARFGFQLCALDANGESIGSLTASGSNTATQSAGGLDFINHDGAVVASNSQTYSFSWTAPSGDSGDITFYATGLAANNADGPGGDNAYNSSSVVSFADTPSSIGFINGETWGFYPNPAKDVLSVLMPEPSGTASIYAVSGKLMQTWNLSQGENTLNLDIQTGIYLLAVEADNGEIYTDRLIVE